MMRRILPLAVALALAVPTAAGAAQTEVQLKDNMFDPHTVTAVAVPAQVHWSRASGSINTHSVHGNDDFFDSGDPTPGAIDLTVVFSAGTFHYYCEIHGTPSGGMDGLVRVPVAITADPSGLPFTVRWATAATETGSAWDVQYRVGSGAWHMWKSATTQKRRIFGKDGSPVTVKNGTRYSFRARSREADAKSRYSPPASFTP